MFDRLRALGELLQLQSEGIQLPMSPERIIDIESQGGVVDLVTGKVNWGSADGDTFKVTDKGKEVIRKES